MLEFAQLVELGKAVAKANKTAPTAYSFNEQNYSYDALQDTFRKEVNELAGDFNSFRRNATVVYQLLEQILDEVSPQRVMAKYGDFAEVKVVSQGQKPVFSRKAGKNRLKKNFVTRVGLAGIYEVGKLDKESFDVPMGAIGGAVQIGLEEWLDGNVDFSELLDTLLEGIDDAVYQEIALAFQTMVSNLGPYNKFSTNTFNEAKFDQLIGTASAYGVPTIYCTFEFAGTVLPAEGWRSDAIMQERWDKGYVGTYKGHRIVVLPQSLTEDNSEKLIDPSWAYIFPGDAKPIKMAFEGQTIVDEFVNKDRSREVQVYKKFGIAAITTPDLVAYQNTSLVKSNALN